MPQEPDGSRLYPECALERAQKVCELNCAKYLRESTLASLLLLLMAEEKATLLLDPRLQRSCQSAQ